MNRNAEILIDAEHVSKKYCRDLRRSLWYGVQDLCAELRGSRNQHRLQLRPKEFLSLDDVSFTLRRGECLGLVGRNGAGKSTLLKILHGLIKPDHGCIRMRGRIAALIELGAGFNPLLTGRENIYVNGAVLGMGRREIDRRLDDIVEFAELADAIDMPLKSYSSGMKVRLGFAIAAQAEPDVLLIDEVLAVGDIAFRAKCYRRLAALRERGVALIVVSHSEASLMTVCDLGLYLKAGTLVEFGSMRQVHRRYEADLVASAPTVANGRFDYPPERRSGTELTISSIYFRDGSGALVERPVTGQAAALCVSGRVDLPIDNVTMTAIVRGLPPFGSMQQTYSSQSDARVFALTDGRFELRLEWPQVAFNPGLYTVKLNVSRSSFSILDIVDGFTFEVTGEQPSNGSMFFHPCHWTSYPQGSRGPIAA